MIQRTLEMALSENYPMIIIFTTVLVSIRIVYLIVHKEKFVFYKEMTLLAFLLYSLLLFYVVTFQDINYGNNFIPFKEIFRYEFGSSVFIHNIIGNIVLFIPFGYFVAHIMKSTKPYALLIISIITSLVIEYTQLLIGRTFDVDDIILNVVGSLCGFLIFYIIDLLERKLPPFFSSDMFKNILIIIVIVILVIMYCNYTLWGIVND